MNKIPVKSDLFQICGAAAGVLVVESVTIDLDIPIPGLDDVKPWIPSLNAGAGAESTVNAIEAIVKKEVNIASTSTRSGRRLLEADRRRLERSISPDSHQGYRMLRADAVTTLNVTCPVNTTAGEYGMPRESQLHFMFLMQIYTFIAYIHTLPFILTACTKMSNLRLNIKMIQELVEKVLEKVVNDDNDGYFDRVAVPLKELAKPLPGISEISGSDITFLVSIFASQMEK